MYPTKEDNREVIQRIPRKEQKPTSKVEDGPIFGAQWEQIENEAPESRP